MTNDERLQKYVAMYGSAIYDKDNTTFKGIMATINKNIDRYKALVEGTSVPVAVVAAIHNRESSLSFTKHLANGDPLTKRTVNVPAGIIPNVAPPYSWEQAAKYVLFNMKRWDKLNWDLGNALDNIERYNGLGYRSDNKPWSPYLWSKTQYYKKGKYVADGKYDPNFVDAQWGCVPILKELGFK